MATTPTVEELETRFALGLREHIIGSLETHVDRTMLLFDWEEANPPRFYAYERALHDALSAIDKEHPCDTPEGVAALLRAAARFTVDVNQGKYIPET